MLKNTELEYVNILYINIRSLRNKLEELKEILAENEHKKTHILVLTETWLYNSETKFFEIDNFSAVHDCRDTRGGGTSIYIKNNLNYMTKDISFVNLNDCNVLAVTLTTLRCTLWSIYRPPSSSIPVFLKEMDKLMEREKNQCLIIGDMNLNLLQEANIISEYKNIITMNAFEIKNKISVHNATRATMRNSSILDHVLANKNLQCQIKLHDHMISDHKIMAINVNSKVKIKNKIEKKIKIKLDEKKWIELVKNNLQGQPDEISFAKMAEIIETSKMQCSKQYTIKIRTGNEWITPDFLKMIKKRDDLYVRWKRLPNEYTENEFKKLKNKVNNTRKQLQKKHAEKKLEEANGDSRKTWRVLNDFCKKNKKNKCEIKEITKNNKQIIHDPTEIAQEMNKHFATVGKNLALEIKKPQTVTFKEEEIINSIFLEPTNKKEIEKMITELKQNCSPGIDKIVTKDIKKTWGCHRRKTC